MKQVTLGWILTIVALGVTAFGVAMVATAIRGSIELGRSLERDRLALQIAVVERTLEQARDLACYRFNEDWQRIALPEEVGLP